MLPLAPSSSRERNPISALWDGSCHEDMFFSLATRPVTIGRSGLPSSHWTITSEPILGGAAAPCSPPLQDEATRTQVELVSSPFASRSQWNWSLQRPY